MRQRARIQARRRQKISADILQRYVDIARCLARELEPVIDRIITGRHTRARIIDLRHHRIDRIHRRIILDRHPVDVELPRPAQPSQPDEWAAQRSP